MSTNTFGGTASTFSQTQSFKFLQPQTLKNPQRNQLRLKMERHFTQYSLCLSNKSYLYRDIWKCGTAVSMRSLIQVENILNLRCKLWLDKQ